MRAAISGLALSAVFAGQSLPPDLPMVPLDGALAEQIFINLLENVLRYTPDGSPIAIAATVRQFSIPPCSGNLKQVT